MTYIKRSLKVCLAGLFLFGAMQSQAALDYSDAGYDEASHKGDSQWQYLGDGISFESGANAIDGFDDGVLYSLDGGLNYSSLLDDTQFTVGQTATFKFTMNKKRYGTHYADHIKSWVDWGADGFDDAEVILQDYQVLEQRNGDSLASNPVETYEFFSDITFGNQHIGDSWLRARVACSSSIGYTRYSSNDTWDQDWSYNGIDWNPATTDVIGNAFMATGYLRQGEVEDYRFNVAAVPVPEPSIIALFVAGLVGIGFVRRRKA